MISQELLGSTVHVFTFPEVCCLEYICGKDAILLNHQQELKNLLCLKAMVEV